MAHRDSPKVSILVPSYNHGRFLRQCLDGVLAQTMEDWELILIDDGSSDDSLEIARSYTDPRISVDRNEVNLGTYGTEQKALDRAKGDFVAVLNSDDLWAPEKLTRQLETIAKYPQARACYTLGWLHDSEGVQNELDDIHLDWPREELQEPLPFLLYENRIFASSVLFRREGLWFDTSCRYSGDWIALLHQSRLGPLACVPERLSYWRVHGENASLRSPKQTLEEIMIRAAIQRQREMWFVPRIAPLLIRRGLAINAMNLFALHIFFRDVRGARRAGWTAIRHRTGMRRAAKRLASSLLPVDKLNAHFWKGAHEGGYLGDRAEGLKMVRSVETYTFRED